MNEMGPAHSTSPPASHLLPCGRWMSTSSPHSSQPSGLPQCPVIARPPLDQPQSPPLVPVQTGDEHPISPSERSRVVWFAGSYKGPSPKEGHNWRTELRERSQNRHSGITTNQTTYHPDTQLLHIGDGVELATRSHDVRIFCQESGLDDPSSVIGSLEMRILMAWQWRFRLMDVTTAANDRCSQTQ